MHDHKEDFMKRGIIVVLIMAMFTLMLSATAWAVPPSGALTVTTAGTGTWTAPAGVTAIKIEAWGAGGGGGMSKVSPYFGDGGGGGAYASVTSFTVIPGTSYSYSVGAGGSGATANISGAGGSGGETTFNTTTCVAAGGNGANGGNISGVGSGATGGLDTASTGNVRHSGGIGFTSSSTFAGGGGGSAGPLFVGNNTSATTATTSAGAAAVTSGGIGGSAATTTGNGLSPLSGPGGGGGGAIGSSSTGGVGAAGQLVITPFTVQSITFQGSGPTVNVGGTGTVSATGGGSGNAVTFTSTTTGVCTVSGTNGSIVTGVTAGSCIIAANQAGNATYGAAVQVTRTITVGKGAQTTLSITGPASITYGTTGTVTTSGGSGTGALSFNSTGTGCTVNSSTGVITVTNASGTCSVTATKATDTNYNSTTSGSQSVTLNKAAPIVTTWPSATAITFSQTLASSTFSGGSYTPVGTFTFTTAGTTPGVGTTGQAVTFTPTDTTNYTTTSGSVNVTVNYSAVKPNLTVSTLADNSVTKTITLNISGSTASTNGIKSVTINGVTQTLGSGNSFSYAYTLVPGANLLTIVATDNADQTTTDTRTITLDQTAPAITITAPTDNSAVNSALLTVTGSVNDANALVDVTLNGGSPQAATLSGLNFSRDLTLTAGANTIQVTATDLAQNSSSVSRTITYDSQAPSVSITSPATDITTDQATITITGTASDVLTTATVSIACDGQTYTPALTAGAYSQVLTFTTAKSYAIVVTATDAAGNQATAQRNVIYQPAKIITIATTPVGLAFTVAGDPTVYTAPHDFSWLQGDKHIISIATPQNVTSGSRSAFRTWSDTGAASHEIIVGATAATYTAQFDSQYQITTAVAPAANGYVLPVNGTWYTAGSTVNVSVVPSVGNRFTGWNGPVANATSTATTVTMSGPVSVTANLVGIPALRARVTGMSGAINNRVWGVEMANSGTGAATSVRITGVTVTKVTGAACTPSVTSTLPLTITDVAQGGIQNSGISIDFTGCAATNKYSVLINYSYGDGGSGSFAGTNSYYNLFR
jgi:Glucodextranase, domain B